MIARDKVRDLRDWISYLEAQGQLQRITAQVDWDEELGTLTRKVSGQAGPALLFENIKGYPKEGSFCSRLFTNGMGSRQRVAMALGLLPESDDRTITYALKERYKRRVEPRKVESGPVKENIIRGQEIDLFKLPVPRWNVLDGGRYINTLSSVVTMDPDTGTMNIGTYRGMIGTKNTIPILCAASQHWGHHFAKYKAMGKEMPVAVVYGWDPTLLIASSAPLNHNDYSEYDIVGSLRNEPVELVKCETSDLMVPASAEIVIEGKISADPSTFEMEGPFAEYVGYYGGQASPKPVIRVECITHRNDPIFRGGLEGGTPGQWAEPYYWMTHSKCAVVWNYLESIQMPNVLGVWSSPITRATNIRVQIRKIYRGHAKRVTHAVWGSHLMNYTGKMVVVVDEDIDVFDDEAVEWALAYRVNAEAGDVQIAHGCIGSMLDPSIPFESRDILKYGQGKWSPVFIDATIDWELEPQEQYGGERYPAWASVTSPGMDDLVKKRWSEYGLDKKIR
jgi:UbiD family decarboxylase